MNKNMEKCVCAKCGEIVELEEDCFCDRLEKNQLTVEDKERLKEHSDYR